MQFGCLACEDIIHVSAHPVTPSFGTTAATGTLSASNTCWFTGQAVPTTMSPDLNGPVSSPTSDQYLATLGCCFWSRSTAALNWSSVSSYGSVIFRSGC